ncbi:hypothetical protein E2542_SST19871 [Spatholobus suberectus]|nr:hypothetical protein E2542_SST19871 [Spatholobus suberectus]
MKQLNPKPLLALLWFILRSDLIVNGFRVQQNRATNINFVHKIGHQIQHSGFFILQTSFLLFSSSAVLLDKDFAGTEMHPVDVAAAQRGGGGEDDVVPERNFQKLPSAFSGHIVNWEFAGPANYGVLLHYQSLVYQSQGDLLEERLKKPFCVCKVGFMIVVTSICKKRLTVILSG